MSLLVSGCIRNQQMFHSGEFSSTQPWRLYTPPLRVSLRRVIGRRVEPRVTPWTQQNPLHMLRLGSDMSLMLDFNCTIFSLWQFLHSLHILHILTPPLSSSCVTWSSPSQRWRASQPKCWGAQWWWVVRTHTDVSAIIFHYKWSIWVVSWESPQTTLCIIKCHSRLSRTHVGGM